MTIKEKVKDTIEDQDIFGHVITLNFDRKGDSHKTWIGGVFSVLIKAYMCFFIFSKLSKLVGRQEANYSTSGILVETKLFGVVPWKNTQISSFFVFKR